MTEQSKEKSPRDYFDQWCQRASAGGDESYGFMLMAKDMLEMGEVVLTPAERKSFDRLFKDAQAVQKRRTESGSFSAPYDDIRDVAPELAEWAGNRGVILSPYQPVIQRTMLKAGQWVRRHVPFMATAG